MISFLREKQIFIAMEGESSSAKVIINSIKVKTVTAAIKTIVFQIIWTEDAVLELATLWEAHQCLYDTRHRMYKNKFARSTAMNEIKDNLANFFPNITTNDIANKMNTLRCSFSKENAKVKKTASGMGSDDVHKPTVFWFEALGFLSTFCQSRKASSTFEVSKHTAI